jgi:PglZ domain
VYLPGYDRWSLEPRPDGTAPDLWSVYEQRYKGALWSLEQPAEVGLVPEAPTLLAWLEHRGVRLVGGRATQRLADGGRDSLLARYAESGRTRDPSEWPSPLKESEVLAALGGDPRDRLRSLIAAPKNAMKLWGETAALTLDGIQAAFGLESSAGNATPDELADAAVVQLALVEAWDAFGRPSDFPFRSRLPRRADQRERAIHFLRTDVLQDMELGPRYRERMLRLEKDVDLSKWAAGRSGQPRGLPLLARARWNSFVQRFDLLAQDDWRGACKLLVDAQEAIEAGRATPWDHIEGDTHWFVLADVRALVQQVAHAIEELARLERAADLVFAFAERWWDIDRLHLRVRAACNRVSGLERVRRVADLSHFHCVDTVNDRFSAHVEEEAVWPPDRTAAVRDLADVLWGTTTGRRGIVISDALRWDLARALGDALSLEMKPMMATIPTTTPFGMTALLPIESSALKVSFQKGVAIKTDEGVNLATRDGRKAFLAAAVRKKRGEQSIGFIDMEDVLKGGELPNTRIVAVFDNTIDEQGHKGIEELPGLAEQLVAKLRRAVERLHEAGIPEVHVVTDHGFLLLPSDMVNGLGKPSVFAGQVLRRESRWCALKPDAPVTELIRLRLPTGQESIVLGFPRGVRTLVETDDFLHGGLSLQETVIPHAVSKAVFQPTRVRVVVAVTTRDLVGGTVPVVLRPASDGQGAFDMKPTSVRLWVEKSALSEDEVVAVTEPVEIEVRWDVDELKPPVYLKEGLRIPAGQKLVLRAVDLGSGEDIAALPLAMRIDWD